MNDREITIELWNMVVGRDSSDDDENIVKEYMKDKRILLEDTTRIPIEILSYAIPQNDKKFLLYESATLLRYVETKLIKKDSEMLLDIFNKYNEHIRYFTMLIWENNGITIRSFDNTGDINDIVLPVKSEKSDYIYTILNSYISL